MNEPEFPMSEHGYPIKERYFKKEIYDDIYNRGLDYALSKHHRLDVLKALGGEEYGARITEDVVISTTWFDSSSKPLSSIEDLIPAMESIGIHFTLTNSLLVLTFPAFRIEYNPVMIARVKKTIQLGKNIWLYTKLSDYEADPNFSQGEVEAMRAECRKTDPINPEKVFEEMIANAKTLNDLKEELGRRRFIFHVET